MRMAGGLFTNWPISYNSVTQGDQPCWSPWTIINQLPANLVGNFLSFFLYLFTIAILFHFIPYGDDNADGGRAYY